MYRFTRRNCAHHVGAACVSFCFSLPARTRPGSVDDMAVLSSEEFEELNVKVRTAAPRGGGGSSLTIGALDFAEAAVQSLLLEQIEGRSFTVCARSSRQREPRSVADMDSASERAVAEAGERRPERVSYYGILSLDDYTDDPDRADALAEEQLASRQDVQQQVDEANAANYSKMRSSYVIRSIESVRQQLLEDEAVEKYWLELLRPLPRDN